MMTHRYAALLGAVLLFAPAACSDSGPGDAGLGDSAPATAATTAAATPSAEPPRSPATEQSVAPSRTATAQAAGAKPGSTGGPAVRSCRNQDVATTVTMQEIEGESSSRRALVAVTSHAKTNCQVKGRVTITLTNAADETVRVRSRGVNQPGPAVRITLRPGTSAFEGIKWQACDKGSSSCGVGNGLRFNLQATTGGPAARLAGFPAGEASAITMDTLEIGTLQPSTQGVVAW
jgi:hypothetical protein